MMSGTRVVASSTGIRFPEDNDGIDPNADVSRCTVSRLLPKRRSPPPQAWRTFLTNHVRDLVSIDFFTVPTARSRVLFVFVVLAHDRRRVLHFNITEHPTAVWTTQQIVDAFPDDSARPISSAIATRSTVTCSGKA